MKKKYIKPAILAVEYVGDLCLGAGGSEIMSPDENLAKPIKPTNNMADWDDSEDEEQSCFD